MRKRKERKRTEEVLRKDEAGGKEVKLVEPEKISENIQHSQEIEKLENTKTSKLNTILSQTLRYAYLLAFFALLAGIFYPLITARIPLDEVIQGIAALFLGLAGAILLFKGATSDKRRGIFIAVGFALTLISLTSIFLLQEHISH
jgi:hypothetical protein